MWRISVIASSHMYSAMWLIVAGYLGYMDQLCHSFITTLIVVVFKLNFRYIQRIKFEKPSNKNFYKTS